MATKIEKATREYPAMTPELFDALCVLTGFAESKADAGDLTAPVEHAADARQVIRATLDSWDKAAGRKAWRVRLADAVRCGQSAAPGARELFRQVRAGAFPVEE